MKQTGEFLVYVEKRVSEKIANKILQGKANNYFTVPKNDILMSVGHRLIFVAHDSLGKDHKINEVEYIIEESEEREDCLVVYYERVRNETSDKIVADFVLESNGLFNRMLGKLGSYVRSLRS